MYQLYILCLTCAVVYGNSDETKYIDLLPEGEKQEFLNRIARRIIEEIQSKDSPEKSHAEVSDDQLNAHHAYVHDLINEESANMRQERRNYNTKDEIETKHDNEELGKDDKDHNNVGITENTQQIDLTLRHNVQREQIKRTSDDSTFSVIPVKVIYDQGDNKTTQSPTKKPGQSGKHKHLTKEQNDSINIKKSQYNNSLTESVTIPTSLVNITEKKEKINHTNIKITHTHSKVSKNHGENTTDNVKHISASTKQNVSHNLVENSTEGLFYTDATLVTSVKKENNNYDDYFEVTESSKKVNISLNKKNKKEDNNATESNVKLSNNNTAQFQSTTKVNIQSESKTSQLDNPSYSTVYYVTTATRKPKTKSKIENVSNTSHNVKKTGENKTKDGKKSNKAQLRLRKRLQFISEEYNIEEEPSRQKNNKAKWNNINRIKQYFVYEVPEEKQVFVEQEYSKENEQPYVVPIYNFEPKNAFYNAYNQFGINGDEDEKAIEREYIYKNSDVFHKQPYFRSGFEIDLTSENHNNRNNNKAQYRYLTQHPRHSHWEHVLNSQLEYNPIFMNYQDKENLRRTIKNKKKSSRPPEYPSEIKYIPLREGSKNGDNDNEINKLTHYIGNILSTSSERSHMGALNTFLYQQEELGYRLPTTYSPKITRGNKNMFQEEYLLEFRSKRKKNDNKKPKPFDMDYYFGKYKLNNRMGAVDSNEYSEVEDIVASDEHEVDYEIVNEKPDTDIKTYGIEERNDCKHGCPTVDLEKPRDNLDSSMETIQNVLQDMIYRDNQFLVNYNWLLSTVNLESALKKLLDLTETIERGNKIHQLDSKLLHYILNLYNTSSYALENTIQPKKPPEGIRDINYIINSILSLLRRRIALPKNKKHNNKMRNPIQIWVKYFIRDGLDDINRQLRYSRLLKSFKIFLGDLGDNLFELHNALKQIAIITTYAKQNWYEDLKNIYLKSASQKQLLQVILHLAASRLFSSIEETAQNAEEDQLYMQHNRKVVNRIQEEFIFVLRILKRINMSY